MQTHKFSGPRLEHIAAPRAAAPSECLFCGEESVRNYYCSSCNTWFPSPLAYRDPEKSPFRRKKDDYTPRFDGISDLQQATRSDHDDELEPYREELDRLDVEADQDADAGADDLPTTDDIEAIPW